jgi:multiple sugar transport system substrate-binding protein
VRRLAWRTTALLSILAVLPAACAKRPKPVDEVVFWQFEPLDAITPLVNKFETENPGVRVRIERLPKEGGRDSISAAVTSGRPPDLCEVESGDMPALLASGSLSDWSAGVADQRDSLRGWDMCRLGDALYGMPWVLGVRAMYWNKHLFAQAGLDSTRAPATWDELYAAASRIQRLGRGRHGFGIPFGATRPSIDAFMPFAWRNGGEILSAGLDSSRFDSPENVQALEFYLRLRKVGLLGGQDSLDREFREGRLGLIVSGEELLLRTTGGVPAPWLGVAPVPVATAKRDSNAGFADGEVLVSFTHSKRKEDALRLARFLVRPENTVTLTLAARNGLPANAGADTLVAYRDRPLEAMLLHQIERARFVPNHPEWDQMARAIQEELGQALHDRKSPAEAIADASARIADLAGKK